MNKKVKTTKLIKVLLIITMLLVGISTTAFAADVYTPDEFKGEIKTDTTSVQNVKSMGGKIVGLIRIVGTIAAVAMLIVLGIKYMMGSAEERAEYKKTLFPYFIGAVLIFGASNLTQIIYTWAIALK